MLLRYALVLVALQCLCVPAHAQTRPLRVAVGYDAATTEGELACDFFEGRYESSSGAFRLDVSYDVLRGRGRRAGFVYATFGESIFAYAYNGYGIGIRVHGGDTQDGFYGGAGVGVYVPTRDLVSGNGSRVGAKLFAGYDTRGAFFVEVGVTLLPVSKYSPAPAIGLGLRF